MSNVLMLTGASHYNGGNMMYPKSPGIPTFDAENYRFSGRSSLELTQAVVQYFMSTQNNDI